MKRSARCHCGDLVVQVTGEPEVVVMCHCEYCQRRTGSSYNLGAWFRQERLHVTGESRTYRRTGDAGHVVDFAFCPNCGTNLFWTAPGMRPGLMAVAVGCFVDPNFPVPAISLTHRMPERPPLPGTRCDHGPAPGTAVTGGLRALAVSHRTRCTDDPDPSRGQGYLHPHACRSKVRPTHARMG